MSAEIRGGALEVALPCSPENALMSSGGETTPPKGEHGMSNDWALALKVNRRGAAEVTRELASLNKMSVGELAEKFREVFGCFADGANGRPLSRARGPRPLRRFRRATRQRGRPCGGRRRRPSPAMTRARRTLTRPGRFLGIWLDPARPTLGAVHQPGGGRLPGAALGGRSRFAEENHTGRRGALSTREAERVGEGWPDRSQFFFAANFRGEVFNGAPSTTS